MRRRLSDVRITPGARVTVTLDVENRSPLATSFLMLEDRLPTPLGRAARLVIGGIRPGEREQATYTLVPQSRGRYVLGPLVLDVSDPFALSRLRLEFDDRDELLVAPEIEDLGAAPDPASGPSFGASRARQLFRTGEEYYTMRAYQEGDDLRRIHWPSVARTGELMIRQDESTRRASGLVFLDTRGAALGRTHTPAFERGVSAAASVGVLLARRGFVLRLGTTELPAAALSEERFLDALTGISHAEVRSIGPGARPPPRRFLSRHVARVRVRASGAGRARSPDPRRRGLRSEARDLRSTRPIPCVCRRSGRRSSKGEPARPACPSPASGGT